MRTARQDSYTGSIPVAGSVQWGMGKVNAYQAVREVLWLNGVGEHFSEGLSIWPNPSVGTVWVMLHQGSAAPMITVTDIAGRVITTQKTLTSGPTALDVSHWAPGIYTIRCSTGSGAGTGIFVKQ